MNYNFDIANSYGTLSLSATKDEVLAVLGTPDEIKHYVDDFGLYSDELENTYFVYNSLGLTIGFNFDDDDQYYSLSIQPNKLIYKRKDWFTLSKKTLLETIKAIYHEKQTEYDFNYEKTMYGNRAEEEYRFDAIGVILWFTNDELSNVSVSMPVV